MLDSDDPGQDGMATQAASDLSPVPQAVSMPVYPSAPQPDCGPDLDAAGDADYLNFIAQIEGILPTSFFSPEDGKPFDPASIDIADHLAGLKALQTRTRDIRLATIEARLLVLNRDIAGFATTISTIADWLEQSWDGVHPRAEKGHVEARQRAIGALDLPTVVFPLQYCPLFEGRRSGDVTFRRWLIATGEAKPREGDAELSAMTMTQALDDADPAVLADVRDRISGLNEALGRIGKAFAAHGSSMELSALSALVGKMRAFVGRGVMGTDAPSIDGQDGATASAATQDGRALDPAGPPPASLADATSALAAIADYYSRREPSSPTLPLVRQARDLVGKSFLEVMTILVPSQVEKAAFQIGTDQVFDLPVGRLSGHSAVASAGNDSQDMQSGETPGPRYRVESRAQAIALLDGVQRYFRVSEPSSPVPMLCERARTMAERDFMSVLRDVLPKAALRNVNIDK